MHVYSHDNHTAPSRATQQFISHTSVYFNKVYTNMCMQSCTGLESPCLFAFHSTYHSVTRCTLLPSADSVNTAPKGAPRKGSVLTWDLPILVLLHKQVMHSMWPSCHTVHVTSILSLYACVYVCPHLPALLELQKRLFLSILIQHNCDPSLDVHVYLMIN